MALLQSKIAVFDIDGTLADISYRVDRLGDKLGSHWHEGFDWQDFFQEYERDIPIAWTTNLLKSFKNDLNMKVLIFTARCESVRSQTEAWLRSHDVEYDDLMMRKQGDYRRDEVTKLEMILPFKDDVAFIFEDRREIALALREAGFNVLQCADYSL